MTEEITVIDGGDEPKRSSEYLQLLRELKQSFVKAGEMVIILYEQGKKDGLPNHIIRKDIETVLDGVVKERRLRELLPLELKRSYTITKQDNSALIAELGDDDDGEYMTDGIFNSIDMHGFQIATVNRDGTIHCWLCMIDKYLFGMKGISKKTIPEMYTNRQHSEHILTYHKGIEWNKYTPHIVHWSRDTGEA